MNFIMPVAYVLFDCHNDILSVRRFSFHENVLDTHILMVRMAVATVIDGYIVLTLWKEFVVHGSKMWKQLKIHGIGHKCVCVCFSCSSLFFIAYYWRTFIIGEFDGAVLTCRLFDAPNGVFMRTFAGIFFIWVLRMNIEHSNLLTSYTTLCAINVRCAWFNHLLFFIIIFRHKLYTYIYIYIPDNGHNNAHNMKMYEWNEKTANWNKISKERKKTEKYWIKTTTKQRCLILNYYYSFDEMVFMMRLFVLRQPFFKGGPVPLSLMCIHIPFWRVIMPKLSLYYWFLHTFFFCLGAAASILIFVHFVYFRYYSHRMFDVHWIPYIPISNHNATELVHCTRFQQ